MTDKPDLATLFGAPEVTTFLGLEKRSCDEPFDASSAFIGAPCATPYQSVGPYAKNGPSSIREASASWAASVSHHNFDVGGPTFPAGTLPAVDCGDLPWDDDYANNRAAIRRAVSDVVSYGAVPVVVGGDDSVPIPMLDALADTGETYTVLQLDAHIDWRDEVQGERLGLSSNMRRASEMDHIDTIIQVGARGVGSARATDVQDALDWGVHLLPAEMILRDGVQQAIDHIPDGANVVACIDVDGLDPAIVPNTIGRAPGGLSYLESLDLVRGAAARGRIAATNFVEIFPEMDVDGIGGITVSRLIAATMGVIARQSQT